MFSLVDRLIAIIAPLKCMACRDENSVLCLACRLSLVNSAPEVCYRCNKLSTQFRLCWSCRPSSSLRSVFITTDYDGLAKNLITELKFKHNRHAAQPIAALMSQQLPFHEDVVLVPIPSSAKRSRERGYDHIEELVRHVAKDTLLPIRRYLRRTNHSRQVGRKRKDRALQVEGLYKVRSTYFEAVRGKHIVLIDDVVTTGATLEACARELRQAGAKHVDALVFARG